MRHLNRFDRAIALLDDPKNEPLRWLFGDALRQHAITAVGSHFLLDTLAEPTRKPVVAGWNARLHQFREFLNNPDQAPIKAAADLRCGPRDAEKKITDFFAEITAVAHLQSLGYSDFSIVLAGDEPLPDFMACFEGQRAAIEVKNLQEPADILRTVATKHWKKISEAEPDRYGFRAVLRHQHCAKLTAAAQIRLCNILTQLPDITKAPYAATLDGGIEIRIERPSNVSVPSTEDVMLNRLGSSKKSQLVIVTGFGVGDLSTDISEVQALFLKALRIVADATPKFFSKTYSPAHRNVIALHWNPPNLAYDPEMLAYMNRQIEKLFEAFDLQLTPVLFCGQAVKVPTLGQYT